MSADVPKLPLEEFEIPATDSKSEAGLKNEYKGSLDFGIIGSGQAGGKIAKSFYGVGYKKVLAINTAEADLNPLELPKEQKMRIGNLQGSGKDMNVGRKATEEAYQHIFDAVKKSFGKVDKIIITLGFGGGTGAGSLQTLISISQEYLRLLGNPDYMTDVLVVGALPSAGELRSDRIRQNTEAAKKQIYALTDAGKVGPIILMDNSKIEQLYRGIPPNKYWPAINDSISMLFQIFNNLSTQQSNYHSFDATDYRVLLSQPGIAVMGVTRVPEKDLMVAQALQDNFKKTLLNSAIDFKTAKAAACVFVVDEKLMGTIAMDVFNYGFDTIANLIGGATVYRGLYDNKGNGIRAYTLISGCKAI